MDSQMDWFVSRFATYETVRLEKGQLLFREGEPIQQIYVVESGCVALRRPLSHGEVLTVHRAGCGMLLAEASLFADYYHCEAVTTEATSLRAYPQREVRTCMQQQPEFAIQIGQHLATQIMALRSRLELAHILSAEERLFTWIRISVDKRGQLELDRSLKTVASELGMAHETLYRNLKLLERKGLVKREGKLLRVL